MDIEVALSEADWVEGLARRLCRDDQEAEDLVQDAWLACLQTSTPVRRVRAWLSVVVRHGAGRQSGRRSRALLEDVESPTTDADGLCVALRRLVFELDEPSSRVVLLTFFAGMTSREIAELDGIPASTVRTRLQRALDSLRGRVERELDDRGRPLAAILAPLLLTGREMKAMSTGAAVLLAGIIAVVVGVLLVPEDPVGEAVLASQELPAAAPAPRRATSSVRPDSAQHVAVEGDRAVVARDGRATTGLRGRIEVLRDGTSLDSSLVLEVELAARDLTVPLRMLRSLDPLDRFSPTLTFTIVNGRDFVCPVEVPGVYRGRLRVPGIEGAAWLRLSTDDTLAETVEVVDTATLSLPVGCDAIVVDESGAPLPRVAPARYRLRGPRLDGGTIGVRRQGTEKAWWTTLRTYGEEDVALTPPGEESVAARVVDRDGVAGIADAVVTVVATLEAGGIWRKRLRSDFDGSLRLPTVARSGPRPLRLLTVRAAGYRTRTVLDHDLVLGVERPVTIAVTSRLPLRGALLDTEGAPLSAASVLAVSAGTPIGAGRTDDAGVFTLRDLDNWLNPQSHTDDARLQLFALSESGEPYTWSAVDRHRLEDGTWTGRADRAAVIAASVADDRGLPLSAVSVHVEVAGMLSTSTTRTDDTGTARLRWAPGWKVVAGMRERRSGSASPRPGDTEVEVRLRRPGDRGRIRIVRDNGAPLRHALFFLRHDGAPGVTRLRTDDEGWADVPVDTPPTCELLLSLIGFAASDETPHLRLDGRDHVIRVAPSPHRP